MRKKISIPMNIENLAAEEEVEESGFCDIPAGTVVANFSFDDGSLNEAEHIEDISKTNEPAAAKTLEEASSAAPNSFDLSLNSSQEITDTRRLKSKPNGKTPTVDGESFEINRTFTLRRSTVRHLSELKAAHPDINVYLNTIVDKAINNYHDYIFNKNGSQD